jgi:hypothetical protein
MQGFVILESGSINVATDFTMNGQITQKGGSIVANRLLVTGGFEIQGGNLINTNVFVSGELNVTFARAIITQSLVSVTGVFNYLATGSVGLITSSILISTTTTVSHVGSGPLTSAGYSNITNYGTYRASNANIMVKFINFGVFTLSGNDSSISPEFSAMPASLINIMNTRVKINGPLAVDAGVMLCSGSISSSLFTFNSVDGYFRLLPPFVLTFNGDAVFTKRSTVFLYLNGTKFGQGDVLNVNGTLQMDPLLLLRLGNDYSPAIGDIVPFLTADKVNTTYKTISLFGAPYKTAELSFKDGVGSFAIVFSFGSIQSSGVYSCHYIGNSKIMEMTTFPISQKAVVSMTVPTSSKWVSFGFNIIANSFASAVSIISKNSVMYEVIGHNSSWSSNPTLLLDTF